jgi:N-acetyltransferase
VDHPWQIDRLDLDAYLARIAVAPRPPSRAALDELHEAHVRTFTFDDIDVLLDQHPGVDLAAVQARFVGRGRGGYCFEHGTLNRFQPATGARGRCTAGVTADGSSCTPTTSCPSIPSAPTTGGAGDIMIPESRGCASDHETPGSWTTRDR